MCQQLKEAAPAKILDYCARIDGHNLNLLLIRNTAHRELLDFTTVCVHVNASNGESSTPSNLVEAAQP
jgi:hypothetical protein